MAGFYIHIPFCKKVCYYCDFHFVASLKHKDEMVDALAKEIINRSKSWRHVTFNTLYFGGGTPSILSIGELNKLTEVITKHYSFSTEIEFTMEANPDDLTPEYLQQLKKETAVNRLSIGTQSFQDSDLVLMNRRHTAIEAYQSIQNALQSGFDNLNIDLIYGTPGLTNEQWNSNISKFIELKAPHLSAYHLTFEPKTVFDNMRKKNKITPVDEEISQQQYAILVQRLKDNNYKHYEISNFGREGFFSKHNTNYWLGEPYIGIGPSAHSFIGDKRSWNISNNTKYCKSLAEGANDYFTLEDLSLTNRFNEYIITSLRTFWGIDFEFIRTNFGDNYISHISKSLKKFVEGEHYLTTLKGFALTEKGWLISDFIMREFCYGE